MALFFPRRSLESFFVVGTTLDLHPSLSPNAPTELYELLHPKTPAWKYFQFRLLGDVPREMEVDWTVESDFVAAKRFEAEDFSCLVVGVWTGVSPPSLQRALFHAGYTAYTLFKRQGIPKKTSWELGKGVGRSYVTLHCPEHLETLDQYLTTS